MTFIGDFSFIFPILLIVLLIVYLAFLFHEVKALPRLLKEEATINDNLVTLKKFKPFVRYIFIDVLTFIGSFYLASLIFPYIFFIVYFLSTSVNQMVILITLSYIILIQYFCKTALKHNEFKPLYYVCQMIVWHPWP